MVGTNKAMEVLLCPVCGQSPSFFAPPFCPWHIGYVMSVQAEAVKSVLSDRKVRSAAELADLAIGHYMMRERDR